MISNLEDHANTISFYIAVFFFALQPFFHLGLLKLILRFLGLRRRWFGWFRGGGLSVNSKFGDDEMQLFCNAIIFALQLSSY